MPLDLEMLQAGKRTPQQPTDSPMMNMASMTPEMLMQIQQMLMQAHGGGQMQQPQQPDPREQLMRAMQQRAVG